MKQFKVLGSITLLGLMLAGPVSAAEFIAPERGGNGNLNLPATETHKNLYVAGGSLTIDSNTTGDLLAAGGMVTVNGNVEKNLFVAGGNVSLNGTVGENLRVAGGNISINSGVTGDLLVGAGNVTLSEKSKIGGDLIVAGGNVVIDSPVLGNLKVAGGSVTINSKINGNVEIRTSKDLTFGPNSVVKGTIVYKGPNEAKIHTGAQVSTIAFTLVATKNVGREIGTLVTLATILKMLGIFVAAWAANRLFPSQFQAMATSAHAKPWHYLGIGILTLIATPILAIVLMITVLGLYLGLALLAAFFLAILVASFLMPYLVGAAIVAWFNKTSVLALTWPALIYGILATTLVGLVPVVGWLVVMVVFAMCLGAVVAHTVKKETAVTL